jgi:uncharacterized RDD family membrane protein YckC
VELAEYSERAIAFAIDWFFWSCASILILLLIIPLLLSGINVAIAVSMILFISFLVRNLYFIYFELAWQGATPGKRIVGLRAVDRGGGPLLPAAVIARNLTREIEAFLPLGILLSLRGRGHGVATWEQLSLATWLLCFSALPLFNRDRMRGGDLIAGTMVIALPRRVLLRDLVERTSHYLFTDRQLDAYGAFELQILEELLRRPDSPQSAQALRNVCDKICRKIDWRTTVPEQDTAVFLKDFYTAERAFLEREQLFGRPRADKHHGTTADH